MRSLPTADCRTALPPQEIKYHVLHKAIRMLNFHPHGVAAERYAKPLGIHTTSSMPLVQNEHTDLALRSMQAAAFLLHGDVLVELLLEPPTTSSAKLLPTKPHEVTRQDRYFKR